MKKINPEKELAKIQNSNISLNSNSKVKTMLIPTLVVACFGVTLLGTSFATNLEVDDGYTIKVDIINGKQDAYIKKVTTKKFSDIIDTDATFSNITCNTGNLEYDEKTKTIYSDNITEDTNCILAFMDDGTKTISKSNLKAINDNDGTTYLYEGNQKNNYLLINDTMFRIIRINGDNTYRLITDEDISTQEFGLTNNYLSSNIPNILNEWVNKLNYENILNKDYDISNYIELKEDLINFDGYNISQVGLLSVNEANFINKNNNDTYLNGSFYLANGYDNDKVYAIVNNKITSVTPNTNLGIRPVINVEITTLKGNGTEESPYEIVR